MHKQSQIKAIGLRLGALAALAVGSFSVNADAAPKLWSYLWDGGSGNEYQDCASRNLESEGQGYDNAGNIKCFSHAFVTGGWVMTTGDCTGATQHRAAIRGNFLVYCSTAKVSWTTQVACNDAIISKFKGQPSTTCTERTLWAFTQGTN